MDSHLTPDQKIDAYQKGKTLGITSCIDATYSLVKELKELIESGQETPFSEPEGVLEGMQIVLSELQGLMR